MPKHEGIEIDAVIKVLPKERQRKIARRAESLINEVIELESLGDLRKRLNVRQEDLGSRMAIAQNAITQLEKRSDFKVSTLRKYAQALGASFKIVFAVNRKEFVITGLPRPSAARAAATKLAVRAMRGKATRPTSRAKARKSTQSTVDT